MRIKHITFHDVTRAAFVERQQRWLEASIATGGVIDAWGSEEGGQARAVFTWRDDEVMRSFDRRLESPGRHTVLYLDEVETLGPRSAARYVAESFVWLKEGGADPWLLSQRAWSSALVKMPGFRGGNIARGRRTFLVTSFWNDEASHRHYLHAIVPGLRDTTRGDEYVARLVRFEGALSPELSFPASS